MVDERKSMICTEKPKSAFLLHMDNSAYHNGQKITGY
jgi:hypothetical protein